MKTGNFIALVALTLFIGPVNAKRRHCSSSPCGNIANIKSPFRLKGDPQECGDSRYEISCENNTSVIYIQSVKYFLQAINYNNYTIRVVDSNVDKNNCSSIPNQSFDFTYEFFAAWWVGQIARTISFVKCENPVDSPAFVSTEPCLDGVFPSNISANSSSQSKPKRYYYYAVDGFADSDWENHCTIELTALTSAKGASYYGETASFMDIHDELAYGFELSWFFDWNYCYFDSSNEIHCHSYGYMFVRDLLLVLGYYGTDLIVLHTLAKFILGTPIVIIFLICQCRKRHSPTYDSLEDYPFSHNDLKPIRYSYSEVKKMTNNFSNKLGEGSYGSVFKGRLRSGRPAAIKVLRKSKANGQDFINEFATIGGINHVNVVRAIGYCVDGSKRVLVYDFISNGSLDNHIFSTQGNFNSLSCSKIFEIALGVARGIGHLHQRCRMRISHFDIKPHNILLDENFVPKISDCGMARLCPSDNSVVSLAAARGRLAYIAPELFENVQEASHKADVYSFGVLLMEMARKRKNLNPSSAQNSSQNIDFPSWVSEQILRGKEIEIGGVGSEEESKMVKKMMIVALWCVQSKACERPLMSRVVEMLQGELECLKTPPNKLSFLPQEEWAVDGEGESSYKRKPSKQSENESASLIRNIG